MTAGKVHTPFKTELLAAIAGERFAARPPHLVGILATKKEDARTYAEVNENYLSTLCTDTTHAPTNLDSSGSQGLS